MQQYSNATILAIETSCDDTCIAIAKSAKGERKFKILSNIISSQVKIHKKYGGVYPTLAKREHQRNLVPVLKQSLFEARLLKSKIKPPAEALAKAGKQKSELQFQTQKIKKILEREPELLKNFLKIISKIEKPKIDAIAITIGPGLEPCLWTGINFAKALAYWWKLPVIPVNHIEAHILANWLTPISSKFQIPNPKSQKINFPAICLIISGGHTQLILIKDFGKYKILGETRDDAAGECFDKVARILGLGYPGGPVIAAEAKKYSKKNYGERFSVKLPRPMINSKDYDFSFSGLKTAVLYNFQSQKPKMRKSKKYIQEIAKEVQQAIIDVLIKKTLKAAKEYRAKTIILGGGVSSNDQLRKQFKSIINGQMPNVNFLVPPKNFCTDNAAMVAAAAYFHWPNEKKSWKNIQAKANLRLK